MLLPINKSSKNSFNSLTIMLLLLLYSCISYARSNNEITVGAEQVERYLPALSGKKVALVVNQTSRAFEQHLVDVLLNKGIKVEKIFAPEHGFRGDHDAGEYVDSTIDAKTGIALVSLYGKNKKPSSSIMKGIDVVVFDIQDVGVRYYTYISTMHYMMEAAADAGIKFIILDRPNPNGMYVDGPILEKSFSSFVGMHPIPLLHGLTVGELALMINGQGWLTSQNVLDLTVITIKNYSKDLTYHLPIKPSPNLPNGQSIALYPSLGFFEATPVSIGRGTAFPFQVIGHDNINIDQFTFTPSSIKGVASKPKLMNKKLKGQDLRQATTQGLTLTYLINWHEAFAKQGVTFFNSPGFMDKLAGTDKLRKAIIAGKTEQQIKLSWQDDLNVFKRDRIPYLLYPVRKAPSDLKYQ